MANVYIEAQPKGHREGSAITGYAVEDGVDRVLIRTRTQAEAVQWARAQGHHPLVARVRHLDDKRIPDHWRSA